MSTMPKPTQPAVTGAGRSRGPIEGEDNQRHVSKGGLVGGDFTTSIYIISSHVDNPKEANLNTKSLLARSGT